MTNALTKEDKLRADLEARILFGESDAKPAAVPRNSQKAGAKKPKVEVSNPKLELAPTLKTPKTPETKIKLPEVVTLLPEPTPTIEAAPRVPIQQPELPKQKVVKRKPPLSGSVLKLKPVSEHQPPAVIPVVEAAPIAKPVEIIKVEETEPTPETVELPGTIPREIKKPEGDLTNFESEPIEIYDRSVDETVEIHVAKAEEREPIAEPEAAITILPADIQVRIVEYRAKAEPEAVIALQSLTNSIETAVTQFQEWAQSEMGSEENLAEVEAVVVKLYQELLKKIGVEDEAERDELVKQFIVELKLKAQREASPDEILKFAKDDEGTHEHKRHLAAAFSHNLSAIGHRLGHMIGKFTVGKVQLELRT